MRVVKEIYKVQPLQIDTVELVPNSVIRGFVSAPVNVVGTKLAAKVTLELNGLALVDGTYEIVCTLTGAAGTGTVKVVNVDTGFESGDIVTGVASNNTVSGVTITVSDCTDVVANDKVVFNIVGDQTYIIPGTVLGKLKTGTHTGKWRPVLPNDNVDATFSQLRVASGFQETDKSKTVLPSGYESNLSNVFTIDVVVYGQIYESVCNGINLKAITPVTAREEKLGMAVISVDVVAAAGDVITIQDVALTCGVADGNFAVGTDLVDQAAAIALAINSNDELSAMVDAQAVGSNIFLTEIEPGVGLKEFAVAVTKEASAGTLEVTDAVLQTGNGAVAEVKPLKAYMPFYAWL
jgi:hypothetical protein